MNIEGKNMGGNMENKMLTPQEIYAMSNETEQSTMQVLQSLKELRRDLNKLKEQDLTISTVNKMLSNKMVEIEGLLTEILKRQEGGMSDVVKDHGIRFLLHDN